MGMEYMINSCFKQIALIAFDSSAHMYTHPCHETGIGFPASRSRRCLVLLDGTWYIVLFQYPDHVRDFSSRCGIQLRPAPLPEEQLLIITLCVTRLFQWLREAIVIWLL